MNKKITFTPLYLQVKNDILERIIKGEWSPGSFLPNEFALAEQYNVSQGTLRKALNELTSEKQLTRYQGKGTAVAVVDEDSSLFPFFFLYDKNQKRTFPSSHILDINTVKADEVVSKALNLKLNTKLTHIKRIRMLEGEAIINENIYIAPSISTKNFFKDNEAPNTLYAYYQKNCGVRVMRVTESIEADMPKADDVKYLDLTKDQPLLMINRISYGSNDLPVEFRVSRINSKKYVYFAELK